MKTFKYDGIVRNEKNLPIGKIIYSPNFEYVEGKDIQVVILRIPMPLVQYPFGMIVYIDGYKYQIPSDLPKAIQQKIGNDWYFSNFLLKRV